MFVVTRSAPNAEAFSREGLEPILADVTQPETLARLPEADTLLFAVGYDRKAGPSIQQVYAEGFARVLNSLHAGARRVIYISTTGVYGPAHGEWVDEATEPNPQRDGGRASLAAERALLEGPWADRGTALRLAGIYGPGRVPYLAKLKAGEPIEAVRTGWLNLIHVDDAASVAIAAADAPSVPPVLCVSDGHPPVREDYYQEAARQIGAPRPTFVSPEEGSPKAARAAADKRVSNRLMLERLPVKLAYPTYREGLASIVAAESES